MDVPLVLSSHSLLLAVQAALVLVLTRTYLWLWSGSAVVLLSP